MFKMLTLHTTDRRTEVYRPVQPDRTIQLCCCLHKLVDDSEVKGFRTKSAVPNFINIGI